MAAVDSQAVFKYRVVMIAKTYAALHSQQAFIIHLLLGQKSSKLLKFRSVPKTNWHINVADLFAFGRIRNE